MNDRLPPQNLECEQGVIGAVLWRDNYLDAVVKILPNPKPFYRESHQILWGAILSLYQAGKPVDGSTVGEELERCGQLARVGGNEALAELVNGVPHAEHATYYAQIVREKWKARELAEALDEMTRAVYSNNLTADELITAAQGRIFDLAEGQSKDRLRSVHEIVPRILEAIDRRRETGEVSGLGSGWDELDDLIGGFQPGQLVIVAARPSMGKSAFALNIADYIAFNLKIAVMFASLEMDEDAVVERLIGSRARVDSWKIRTGQKIGYDEIAAMGAAQLAMNFPLLWLDDSSSQSVIQIMASARTLARRGPLGAIFVDYIQLVEPENHRESRQEQVAKISRRLKQLARELKVPVIALSQLNRKVEDRDDHRPRMADLRESGGIEQDADLVMLLHRADYYDADREFQPVVESEIIVAKNRNGATGTVKLGMNLPCMRFDPFSKEALPPYRNDERF